MKTVYINEEGFVNSIYKNDGKIKIEIPDELAEKISTYKFGYNGCYVNNEFTLVCLNEEADIRKRREEECFRYINRGNAGYKKLTEVQLNELDIGYTAGLDAPNTKVIPEKPEGLK